LGGFSGGGVDVDVSEEDLDPPQAIKDATMITIIRVQIASSRRESDETVAVGGRAVALL